MAGVITLLDQPRTLDALGRATDAIIYFYYSGTTTLAPIFNDEAMSDPAVNPIELAAGEIFPDIFLDPSVEYRRRILYGDGTIHDIDPIPGGAIDGDAVTFIQNGAGAVVRTVQDKERDIVSVKDFGAKGDGVTDDTGAVQLALNSGASDIYVPNGIYVVSNLTASNVKIYGQGTFRKKAVTKGILLSLTGTNEIRDVIFDYDWSNALNTPPYFDNISVQQVGGSIDFISVTSRRSFACGLYVLGATANIKNCKFIESAPHNNMSGGNERVPYYIVCTADAATADKTVSVQDSYFEGTSLVAANLHLNPTGIFVTASAVDGFQYKTVNISNNVLLGCTTNAGGGNITGAVEIYNGAQNCVVSDNSIRYFTYAGIKVQNSTNAVISNNNISGGAVPSGAHTLQSQGIVTTEKNRGSTQEQKRIVINGNTLAGCQYIGINNSCDYAIISDNSIDGVALATNGTGIENFGNNVLISGNIGTDIQGVMIISNGDNIIISDNVLDSGAIVSQGAVFFTGKNIAINDNSFIAGLASSSSGIRTNGPSSYIRIWGNYFKFFAYGIDVRVTGGAVSDFVTGPNQFETVSIADYNVDAGVTSKTRMVMENWP